MLVESLTGDALDLASTLFGDLCDDQTACVDHAPTRSRIGEFLTTPDHAVRVVSENGQPIAIALTRAGRICWMHSIADGPGLADWLAVTATLCTQLVAEHGEAYGHYDESSRHLMEVAVADGRWAVDETRPWRIDWVG